MIGVAFVPTGTVSMASAGWFCFMSSLGLYAGGGVSALGLGINYSVTLFGSKKNILQWQIHLLSRVNT